MRPMSSLCRIEKESWYGDDVPAVEIRDISRFDDAIDEFRDGIVYRIENKYHLFSLQCMMRWFVVASGYLYTADDATSL